MSITSVASLEGGGWADPLLPRIGYMLIKTVASLEGGGWVDRPG